MTLVSDSVWQSLDHHAGRLPRRTSRRLAAAGAAALVLCLLAVAGWTTGVVWPRLVLVGGQGSSADSAAHTFELSLEVANEGIQSVIVADIGRSGPGLLLTRTTPAVPFVLVPGERIEMTVAYQVTGCDDVPTLDWPVPVWVDRFIGAQRVWVHPLGTTSAAAPTSYTYSGADPYLVPWQVVLAAQACGRARP
ncbi:hypothetical protein F4553_007784 [Allocatelliglobosispora scoriae]|uniref:Uncharacterized protein n=1 Tax=Allocatelliglobosispora scoriae TaxID=643052 RepID=A0A841C5X8_9ACTN|nr:hypothetical protein [Allocatelliglobosispora scoriae]MBB5874350.1 hypothetical protein [Allocatelliglobosispora scoriae]